MEKLYQYGEQPNSTIVLSTSNIQSWNIGRQMRSGFRSNDVSIAFNSSSLDRRGSVTAFSSPEFQLDGTRNMELRSHVKPVYW